MNRARANVRLPPEVNRVLYVRNLPYKITAEEIEKSYGHLFEVNDKAKGGSFYLQSKVVRARERLDQEAVLAETKQGPG